MKDLNVMDAIQEGTANAIDLAYFFSLQESKPAGGPVHTVEKWNQRAEAWEKKGKKQKKNKGSDDRIDKDINYLEQRGLLQANDHVVDIGCGPGRFAAAFGKRVEKVVGLDFSETMIQNGMAHVRREGLTNVSLRTCDFQSLDIEKETYKEAFDLVFSSLTPAIHGMKALQKSIEMSRAWCCNVTHLGGHNYLREEMMEEVFSRQAPRRWTGRWFYSLFNVLFLLGYDPETSYERRRQESWVRPDEEYVAYTMEQSLPAEEATKENADKIRAWLQARANEEGLVREVSHISYGRILWDVRKRTARPEYRTEDVEA